MSNTPLITIVTPTTGKEGLQRLISSLEKQSVGYVHILLWDDKREGDFLFPDAEGSVKTPYDMDETTQKGIRYSIVIPGSFVQGYAYGSALRSIGLMAANTPYVTFADDDVWFEPNHLDSLLASIGDKKWAYCVRKIWSPLGECIGEDRFESIGEETKMPYNLIDNNSLLVERKFAASSACIYRETCDYNDDRLMYSFLKQYAGEPAKTDMATVNQICPERLEGMFREGCTSTEQSGLFISDVLPKDE